tara:strand:+ start:1568 stop:1831 length:264 start_codon:yes stop_codon:yes gene_type:complete
MESLKQIAELATLHLRNGNRFCGKNSDRRTGAIKIAIDALDNGFSSQFISTEQVESRPEITIAEVERIMYLAEQHYRISGEYLELKV